MFCFDYEYIHPDWNDDSRIHNWKNYATDDLRNEWDNFSDNQKIIIGKALQEIALQEEWD